MRETRPTDSESGLPSAAAWRANSEATSGSTGPAPTEAASSSSSRRSVLIVEDDRAARRAIALILGRLDFATSEAGTVADAMDGLSQRPDWILLDLMLPDGDGADVLRKVPARSPFSRTCI